MPETGSLATPSEPDGKGGAIKFKVLALDYDGTIAVDGVLDKNVRAAIVDLRKQGIDVILVTGRILREIQKLVGDLRLFLAIVAENGAVLAYPAIRRSTRLGQPPSGR